MTEEQTTIFGAGRTLVDGKPLTPRQQHAFDMVRRSSSGVDADEVGADWHAFRGKHADDVRCQWCGKDGLNVLRSAALLTLVTRKRASGRFYCRNAGDALVEQVRPPASEPTSDYDPATAPIPF